MSVAILIVSHQPDSWWLRIALQSIRKYAMGFERVVVACPSDAAQQAVLRPICEAGGAECVPIDETPGKGRPRVLESKPASAKIMELRAPRLPAAVVEGLRDDSGLVARREPLVRVPGWWGRMLGWLLG